MNTSAIKTFLSLIGFKIMLNDFIKYHFNKQPKSFNTINPWSNKTYSLIEREEAVYKATGWLLNKQNLHKDNEIWAFSLLKGWQIYENIFSEEKLSSLIKHINNKNGDKLLNNILIGAERLIQSHYSNENLSKNYTYNNICIANSLSKLFKVNNNPKYKEVANEYLDITIDYKLIENCKFDNNDDNKQSTFKIATVIDALLNCGINLNEQKYIDFATTLANILFTIYNRKKYLPAEFDNNWKQTTKYINLHACAIMSVVWLKLYEITKNIQYINTSLKINDFLISCQCNINDKNINGSLPEYFPYWADYNSNFSSELLLDALILENQCLKSIN